jgi:hypothetical protein
MDDKWTQLRETVHQLVDEAAAAADGGSYNPTVNEATDSIMAAFEAATRWHEVTAETPVPMGRLIDVCTKGRIARSRKPIECRISEQQPTWARAWGMTFPVEAITHWRERPDLPA